MSDPKLIILREPVRDPILLVNRLESSSSDSRLVWRVALFRFCELDSVTQYYSSVCLFFAKPPLFHSALGLAIIIIYP